MSLTSSLVGRALRRALRARARRLADERFWARNALDMQREQLRWLLRRAARTRFGQEHDFARLAQLEGPALEAAYRQAVPVSDYPRLKPWLDRMFREAEPDVLWPGLVRDWAQTSGTTAGEKFVPVSREAFAHNRKAALDAVAYAMLRGVDPAWVFAGKTLVLGGSSSLVVEPNGMRWGDLSGLTTRLMRWPFSTAILPSRETSLLGDWSVKLARMARESAQQDVRWLNGMPSWTLKLFDALVEHARAQGRDVACVRDVWPNLRVFVHGGVRYDPFEPRVRQAWSGDPAGDDIPVRIEAYAASEGFIALQDRAGDPGLRLNLDHRVHYEFAPLEEAQSEAPTALGLDSVETNRRYALVMSTCAGLWRFMLGDVVEFDTLPPQGPPRLRIVGRVRHFMNAFGEHIIVDNIERAVVAAQRACGLATGEFTAAPVYPRAGEPARIELAVEFESPPTQGQLLRFAQAFDEALQRENMDYAAKRRNDTGIAPPRVTPLALGAFHAWMQAQGKLGGQHKCPRCANDRSIVDAVVTAAQRLGPSVDGAPRSSTAPSPSPAPT